MKIYGLPEDGEFRELIAYQCDNCGFTVYTDYLPSDFIEEQERHYCFECQKSCKWCDTYFSIPYAKSWFVEGICENCQDKKGDH